MRQPRLQRAVDMSQELRQRGFKGVFLLEPGSVGLFYMYYSYMLRFYVHIFVYVCVWAGGMGVCGCACACKSWLKQFK